MNAPYSYIPAVPVAIGFGGGILCGMEWNGMWCAAIFAIAAITLFVTRRRYFSFVLAAAALGAVSGNAAKPDVPESGLIGEKLYFTGEVRQAYHYQNSCRIIADISAYSPTGKGYRRPSSDTRVSILTPVDIDSIDAGDVILFYGRLSASGDGVDLPYETDYSAFDIVDGVNARARIQPDHIFVTERSHGIKAFLSQLRHAAEDLIYSLPVNSETAWFLSAVMLGDDSMLGDDIKESFRATGLAHILALSGMHTGIIALLVSAIFSLLKLLKRGARYRHLAVIAAVWLFVAVTGGAASVVRAATVITIMLAARMLQRDTSAYNSLAIAALVILSVAPRQIYSPGFQLSFAAVASILVFARRLNPVNERRHLIHSAASLFTVSVSAVIGTALLTAFYFHRLPLLFLFPNIIMAALLPVIIGIGAIMALLTAVGLTPIFPGHVCDAIYDSGLWVTDRFAAFDNVEADGIFLTAVFVICAYIALCGAAFAFVRRRHLTAAMLTAAIAVCAASCSATRDIPAAELYVTRHYLHTEIILRHGDSCLMLSTSKPEDTEQIRRRAEVRYADFLAHRRCRGGINAVNGDFNNGPFRLIGDRLVAGKHSITVASGKSPKPITAKTDYLLMCRGYRHDFRQLLSATQPDTVLLSADLPKGRLKSYTGVCDSLGIPVRDIGRERFSIMLE